MRYKLELLYFALKLYNLYSTERNSKQSKKPISSNGIETNWINKIYIVLDGIRRNAIQIFSEGIETIFNNFKMYPALWNRK